MKLAKTLRYPEPIYEWAKEFTSEVRACEMRLGNWLIGSMHYLGVQSFYLALFLVFVFLLL
jgi:hypothetical protein